MALLQAQDHQPAGNAHGERVRLHYRPDIDGLRALAVLPVVCYHAGVRGFSGGFVGVDIFFVISGYLITGILLKAVASERYPIATFYSRRILRIFPALFVMFAVVTIVASVTLLPSEALRYAKSLGASALFSSNIFFYLETDYFGLAATGKPLLHTWSLAVEEQWYILWPLIIAAIGRDKVVVLRWMTVATIAVSLVIAVVLVQKDASAAFFLLPSRAWELGIGALLAMLPAASKRGYLSEFVALVGLALILFSVKTYTHDTAFPGLSAVPPCLGAAMLIWSGATGTLISRALSWPIIRFVGLISFSLYLWHWPAIVFAKVGLLLPDSLATQCGVIALSLILAAMSWKLVECPFRQYPAVRQNHRVLVGGIGAMATTIVVALAVPSLTDATTTLSPQQAALSRYLDVDGDGSYRRGSCFIVGERGTFDSNLCLSPSGRLPSIVIAGDSHAAHLWPGFSLHSAEYDVLQVTATGCVPARYKEPASRQCERLINWMLTDWIPKHPSVVVLLAGRWRWKDLETLEQTLVNPDVRMMNLILIGPIAEYEAALPRLLIAGEARGDPGLAGRSVIEEVFAIDEALRLLAKRTNTRYISMIDIVCPRRRCRTWAGDGIPMQFDNSHLTREGSAFVANSILSEIRTLQQR